MLHNIFGIIILVSILFGLTMCQSNDELNMKTSKQVNMITLDPGHFHAALVQKNQYVQVSPTVYIYAPEGDDLKQHLKRIEGFNSRLENPTNWDSKVYTGTDYFEKMISQKPGNMIILSGNNMKKTEYIMASVDAGLNVLADKPMCIDRNGFDLLLKAFKTAENNKVLLYDIMTERSEITTILQKELIEIPEIFGKIVEGTVDNPAIIKESVHHFFKYVSGNALVRPAWFFDSSQQGDGLVDVTSHLVDLIQWELFPEQIIDYKNDIRIISSRRWPTQLSLHQFGKVTKLEEFPEYFNSNLNDNVLSVYSNGEINYKIKGVNAKVIVEWKYQAPEGAGDTHYSIIRGTKANIIIKQGEKQNYKPELYIEANSLADRNLLVKSIPSALENLSSKYPGISVVEEKDYWHVIIPDNFRIGHEAHFGQVMQRYLLYLEQGKLPDWEVPNMIAKYYTTTQALELAN